MKNLSHSLLIPLLKLSRRVSSVIDTTYIGHIDFEGEDKWGNYLYLAISPEFLDDLVLSELRNHNQYASEIDDVDFVLFAFRFTPQQKASIVIPFTLGKYSEIDREYVKQNFPMYNGNQVSFNWRILHKDIWQLPKSIMGLREYWLRRIGQPIPEDAEVWSKPKKEEEIFNFTNAVIEKEIADINSGCIS